jgi:hypothetical protein
MAMSLERIAREPEPRADRAAAHLLADLREGVETYRIHMQERVEFAHQAARLKKLLGLPGVRQAVQARRDPRVRRALGPVYRRLRG